MKAKKLLAGVLPALAAMMMAVSFTSCEDEPGPPPPPGASGQVWNAQQLASLLCSGAWQGTFTSQTPQGYQSTTEVFYFLDGYNGVYRRYYQVNSYPYDSCQPFTYRCYNAWEFDIFMADGNVYEMNYSDYTIYDQFGQYGMRGWLGADYDWLAYYGYYF